MRQSVHVNIIKKSHVGFSTGVLVSLAKQTVRLAGPAMIKKEPRLSVDLIFVTDPEIRRLNKQYRSIDKPTDVLSFSFLDKKGRIEGEELGEIVISVDRLRKQAQTHKHALRLEASILFVHGLLHILGFDHERPQDLKKMLANEKRLLGSNAGLIERAGLKES